MGILRQERVNGGQVFPHPEPGDVVEETPPAFIWLKVEGIESYTLVVRDAERREVYRTQTPKNYHAPDVIFKPGAYAWNVYGGADERGWHAFTIAEHAVAFLRPTASDVLAALSAAPKQRPRHLFARDDIPGLLATKTAELETLRRNIDLAVRQGMPPRPMFHRDPGALAYREAMGLHREYCDRNLVACALGHALLGDKRAGAYARECLLTICDWNPAGPCAVDGSWGDEFGLSHARCLPAVYDCTCDLFDGKERDYIEQTIAQYAFQCERRLRELDFGNNPGNSHAGRLPAYLGEAALVLYGTGFPEETLGRWLAYALEIYGTVFPFFGGPDGGWAEGTFYASSYTKWYLPFFLALERACGKSFLDRPFYRNVSQLFLHTAPPGWESHPFCDGYWCGSDDPEWPGFFAQNPFRVYAERFGPELARAWCRKLAAPGIFNLHLLDIFVPPAPTANQATEGVAAGQAEHSRVFRDAGLVSIHTKIDQPDEDIAILARASRYGSVSHQHADQGSFALISRGRTLITPSGYFGRRYGSRHHLEWTRTTAAHNCILVDGEGQKTFSHEATGRILSFADDGVRAATQLDLVAAYPMLASYRRTIEFIRPDTVVVMDELSAPHPVSVSWLLHSLSEPETLADGAVRIRRDTERVTVFPPRLPHGTYFCTDRFGVDLNEGEPPEYHVERPVQYHLRWDFPPAASLRLTFRLELAHGGG